MVDGIFAQIAKVLDDTKADYVKMDMNRHLTDIWSKTAAEQNQGAILHRYVLGVYDFLERLHERYPDLLIEGCSGGGGRFDAGMLYYTPQIWCSDNTNAVEPEYFTGAQLVYAGLPVPRLGNEYKSWQVYIKEV